MEWSLSTLPRPSALSTATLPSNVWRRNLFAVTAASFMGFTGFTLVMPFLPLFIGQLGVTDVGEVALWTGLCLGVTPAVTAMLSPWWGRLADRYGRKIMVERSLVSFVVMMAAMAYVTRAWHVLALRIVQGLFAGYGSISIAMAAESAPPGRMPQAIGLVQTAQRLGPGVGPVIGGVLAHFVGLRRSFLVTAAFYGVALLFVFFLYDERATHASAAEPRETGPVTFRSVLAFDNFLLMMAVIFGLQFFDRSFGPILSLYVEQVGVARSQVALVAGILFSVMACAGALGHHFCGRLLTRFPTRTVIAGGGVVAAVGCAVLGSVANTWLMVAASTAVGVGIGAAMTASYTAAGSVIPSGAHGTGFGVLTSASLVGMAISPIVAGFLGSTAIRTVFLVDVIVIGFLSLVVRWAMKEGTA
jgi:DHA1 family multidrug resistance protein-like MFS transporter